MGEVISRSSGICMTEHARTRLSARGLSEGTVLTALVHGREVHKRGAVLFAIGRKEVARARADGMDISQFEGVHVVCTTDDLILTAYRNRNLRGLRPTSRTRTVRYRFTAEQKRNFRRRVA